MNKESILGHDFQLGTILISWESKKCLIVNISLVEIWSDNISSMSHSMVEKIIK